MMESYPDIILVLNDLGVGVYHLAQRSTCHQKLHSHILELQQVHAFDVATMIKSFFIQDQQRCETLGETDIQPHHHFLSEELLFLHDTTSPSSPSAPFIAHTHVHFDNYRHYQCQSVFCQNTGFL